MTALAKLEPRNYEDFIMGEAEAMFSLLAQMEVSQRIELINKLRLALHELSPFKEEPVDCVLWIPAEKVIANDYNPNTVAPPEMKLLELSIEADGYTQPIVSWINEGGMYEVVDGFHRHRIGRESLLVASRIRNYLPVTVVNEDRTERRDRISSTIRHNRARGKHSVEGMSAIVVELKRRGWANERICRELGMDQDEVLRLCQITGLAELFSDQEFSRAWDVEGKIDESDFQELSDDHETYGPEVENFRSVNTSDESRIFHTHDKWECYQAGFYATTAPDGMTKEQCEKAYRNFLSDIAQFSEALHHVITEWKHSCEHYLTNKAMNRIAWLGQAAACYALGIPASFRGGFHLLSEDDQLAANQTALKYLNRWLEANARPAVNMEQAMSGERQSDIY